MRTYATLSACPFDNFNSSGTREKKDFDIGARSNGGERSGSRLPCTFSPEDGGSIAEFLIGEGSKLSGVSLTLRRFFTVITPRHIPDPMDQKLGGCRVQECEMGHMPGDFWEWAAF